jgi:hypothetical protein
MKSRARPLTLRFAATGETVDCTRRRRRMFSGPPDRGRTKEFGNARWCVAFFALLIAVAVVSPARADFSLVRWAWGDCRIWDNFPGNPPAGIPGRDWTVLARHIPTYGEAWGAFNVAVARRACRWI